MPSARPPRSATIRLGLLARWGAVEVGGTKVLCLVGSDPDHIVAQTRIPTGKPATTLAQVFAFFQREESCGGPLAALGPLAGPAGALILAQEANHAR